MGVIFLSDPFCEHPFFLQQIASEEDTSAFVIFWPVRLEESGVKESFLNSKIQPGTVLPRTSRTQPLVRQTDNVYANRQIVLK